MKILLATGLFPPEIGGPATYAALLAERLPQSGVAVDILPFSEVRGWPKGIRHLLYTWKLLRRARSADIIFVQDTVSTGLPAALAARILRKPLLLRVPGDYAWEQGRQRFGITDSLDAFQKTQYDWRIRVLRRLQRFVVRSARRVIVASAYFQRIVQGWEMDASQIIVIHNAIESVREPSTPRNIPPGHIVLTAGRLVRGKGFHELIDTVAPLGGWSLVIVGDGPLRGELEGHVSEIRANNIFFTGNCTRSEMEGWYRSATAFVLNSESESFSFQILEALGAGAPVITTRVGALPELVSDGVEGVLVEPNDTAALRRAIESVKKEPDAWRSRVVAGKRKAELFKPETMIEQFISVCKQIV